MDKMPLSQLLGTAKTAAAIEAKRENKVPAHEAHRVRKELRARMVAQEYVRNGMNFVDAWKTVTGTSSAPNNLGMMKALGAQTDVFMDEISKLINKSDVDKEKALGILWTMVNTSILDFMDDEGNIQSIAELKKLPRVMQLMISKVNIVQGEQIVLDKNKQPILDDNGSPYVTRTSKVHIEIPERLAALNQLAQIMRWVGPTANLTINLNVGKLMEEADQRAARAGIVYDQATGRVDP